MTSTFTWSHVLYRFYDAGGNLLYIGITNDIRGRFPGHAAQQPWWSEVADCRTEFLPNREALEEAEVVAIQTERPRYNIRHNPAAVKLFRDSRPKDDIVEAPAVPQPEESEVQRISLYEMEPPLPGARLREDCWTTWWQAADGRTIILPGSPTWSQQEYDEQQRREAAGLDPERVRVLVTHEHIRVVERSV